jgi:hypothetical protein
MWSSMQVMLYWERRVVFSERSRLSTCGRRSTPSWTLWLLLPHVASLWVCVVGARTPDTMGSQQILTAVPLILAKECHHYMMVTPAITCLPQVLGPSGWHLQLQYRCVRTHHTSHPWLWLGTAEGQAHCTRAPTQDASCLGTHRSTVYHSAPHARRVSGVLCLCRGATPQHPGCGLCG